MKNKRAAGNSAVQTVLKNIATLGFIGYLPYAPGTFGSLVGLVSFLIYKPSLHAHIVLIVTGTLTGICASSAAERLLGEKDSRKIVIDELIGFYVAAFYLPESPVFIVAAFLLFRFFDILKPLPINKLEKALSHGFGIMADDILAGIFTNVILQILLYAYKFF
ncbi:MAG: phosphatidylglycerophosphatase A [Nitrospirota bacterium]